MFQIHSFDWFSFFEGGGGGKFCFVIFLWTLIMLYPQRKEYSYVVWLKIPRIPYQLQKSKHIYGHTGSCSSRSCASFLKLCIPIFNVKTTKHLAIPQYGEVLTFNLFWSSGAIWWHRSRSTLAQLMACWLTAPSHYLNQCWHQWLPITANWGEFHKRYFNFQLLNLALRLDFIKISHGTMN